MLMGPGQLPPQGHRRLGQRGWVGGWVGAWLSSQRVPQQAESSLHPSTGLLRIPFPARTAPLLARAPENNGKQRLCSTAPQPRAPEPLRGTVTHSWAHLPGLRGATAPALRGAAQRPAPPESCGNSSGSSSFTSGWGVLGGCFLFFFLGGEGVVGVFGFFQPQFLLSLFATVQI